LQVIVPAFNGPIYEGIFTNICSLFSSPNFQIMIIHTQHGFRSLFPIAFQAVSRCIYTYIYERSYVYAPAVKAAASAESVVWPRACFQVVLFCLKTVDLL